MATKRASRRIGIRDRLGRLTFRGACRLLGDEGEARLRQSSRFEIDLPRDVYLGGDTLRVNVPDPDVPEGQARVTFVEMTSKPKGIHFQCEQCEVTCDHIAAVFGLVLEEKLTLGLSAPPDETEPVENLTEDELLRRAWLIDNSAPTRRRCRCGRPIPALPGPITQSPATNRARPIAFLCADLNRASLIARVPIFARIISAPASTCCIRRAK